MGANGVEPLAQTLGIDLRRVGVDAVCGGFPRTRLAGVAVLRGRRRGLIPSTQAWSSSVCCIGQGLVGFSAGAGEVECGRAGSIGYGATRGWRVDMHSMPCMYMCGMRPERARACGNASGALGVHGACTIESGQGLRRDLRLVGAAGNDWAVSMVAGGR
jgi:hypothetical protein